MTDPKNPRSPIIGIAALAVFVALAVALFFVNPGSQNTTEAPAPQPTVDRS